MSTTTWCCCSFCAQNSPFFTLNHANFFSPQHTHTQLSACKCMSCVFAEQVVELVSEKATRASCVFVHLLCDQASSSSFWRATKSKKVIHSNSVSFAAVGVFSLSLAKKTKKSRLFSLLIEPWELFLLFYHLNTATIKASSSSPAGHELEVSIELCDVFFIFICGGRLKWRSKAHL